MDEELVTITQSEYNELLADSKFLRGLIAAGVDNWDGYSHAMEFVEDDDE